MKKRNKNYQELKKTPDTQVNDEVLPLLRHAICSINWGLSSNPRLVMEGMAEVEEAVSLLERREDED